MDSNSIKKCCFFGHREIVFNEDFDRTMTDLLIEKIKDNYLIFYLCMDNALDERCFEILRKLKQTFKEIRLIICFADMNSMRRKYPYWEKSFDGYKIPELQFGYWYTRLYYRNVAIIDESDFCFFYVERSGGAYKALKHALKTKKPFLNLAPNVDL